MSSLATRPAPIPVRPASRPVPIKSDSLHVALEQILACEDPGPAFRARLERHAPFLAAEFLDEESPGGLHAEILEIAPRLAQRVAELEADHVELLAELRDLLDLLASSPAGSRAAQSATRRLRNRLAAHRREEESLLMDAHFQDVGGEGS